MAPRMAEPTLRKSTRKGKRFIVTFNGKTVHFGSASGQAYVDHGDREKRAAWLARHGPPGTGERWDDPTTPAFWSRHVLWGDTPDLDKSFAAAVRLAKVCTT